MINPKTGWANPGGWRKNIWETSWIPGLGIGHLSNTEGSQLRPPKSIAFCCKNAAQKEHLFGYFEGTLRLTILMLPISLDSFWQSLSMVQSTTNSFTNASRKLHKLMLPAHSPWWRTLWEWISNGCLWISMDLLWISMDFLWISMDFHWFCFGKHNDLELIANFALVFAGIAHPATEIHSVFTQKIIASRKYLVTVAWSALKRYGYEQLLNERSTPRQCSDMLGSA